MSISNRKLAPALGLGLALLALPFAFAQRSGDAERGRDLFYVHGCYGCHGFNGETGAQDLVGTGSPIVTDENLFVTFLRLRADQAPLLPTTRMPNYPENALSDEDARDIFAFVSGLQLNAPPADEIATFEAILNSAEQRK
jgi:mono/diheme cytochrome c family protein